MLPLSNLSNKIFYLYRHIRLDTNQPFYIGIGTKNLNATCYSKMYTRGHAHSPSKRTVLWQNIYKKSGKQMQVDILFETNDVELIKQKEIEFIQLYKRHDCCGGTLTNHTNGGDGINGFVLSATGRLKKSVMYTGAKNPFYNKVHSAETIRHLSEFNILHGKKGKDHLSFGKSRPQKIKDILSVTATNRWNNGTLHLPPVLTGIQNTSSKLILAISPDNKLKFLVPGCIKPFCQTHFLSHDYYKRFLDKGKCYSKKPSVSKGASLNTIGWQFYYMGQCTDLNLKQIQTKIQQDDSNSIVVIYKP